jgi:hypothetical protein
MRPYQFVSEVLLDEGLEASAELKYYSQTQSCEILRSNTAYGQF